MAGLAVNFSRLLPVAGAAVVLSGCSAIYDHFGGNFRGAAMEMEANISAGAMALVRTAFDYGKDEPVAISDHHLHIVARGTTDDSRDAYVHPDLHSWSHPVRRLRTKVLMSASGVDDYEKLDQQYEKRLLELLKHFQHIQQEYSGRPVKSLFYLYAMDYYHDDDGKRNPDKTDLYVPNDYVMKLAEKFNSTLTSTAVETIPVASVHPYRDDFEDAIARLASSGVKVIKWLPPSMNIDMSKVAPSRYRLLADKGMTLLVHTGDEHVLRVAPDKQQLGDPLALRYALDQGATVVALHSGREGRHPVTDESYFDRFEHLMGMEGYKKQLSGEISAITIDHKLLGLVKGSQELIPRIIKLSQPGGILHKRILNGSDYPLPAVCLLNSTGGLARRGMISADQKKWLDEIYAYNPLLFDFVTKRTIGLPGTDMKLPAAY